MPLTAEFTASADQITFITKTNGDAIEISRVHLGAEAAANLATLINDPNGNLIVEVKRETEPD